MKTLLSLAALTLMAQDTFKANPDIDKVFATQDGNIFLPNNLNLARNHARQEKLEVQEITRAGAMSTDVLEHIQTDAAANELKRQADVANAANNAPANVGAPAVPAVPVEAAAAAQADGKADAVNATEKKVDAPATDGEVSQEAKDKAAADAQAAADAKAKADADTAQAAADAKTKADADAQAKAAAAAAKAQAKQDKADAKNANA